jgi:hypothetical protein
MQGIERQIVQLMNDELKRIWKAVTVAKQKYHEGICLQNLNKNTTNLSQDSRCLDRNLNSAPPEHECTALPTWTGLKYFRMKHVKLLLVVTVKVKLSL